MRILAWATAFVGLMAGTAVASPKELHELGPRTELASDEDWATPGDIVIRGDAVIVTHGHNLSWQVSGNLKIEGSLKIVSFADPTFGDAATTPLDDGKSGTAGRSFNRGPKTEGCGVSCKGKDGGPGTAGDDGTRGTVGHAGGEFNLLVGGSASGPLALSLVGADGGNGSDGGAGGAGGDGQQGGRARPNKISSIFGDVVVGCKAGPGSGGNGGAGGAGGAGGQGGDGGAGGRATILVGHPEPSFVVNFSVAGGHRGNPGKPGIGGPGGKFGYGGRGTTGCEGREIERKGKDGPDGPDGVPGSKGTSGEPGKVTALPISIPLQAN